MPTRILLVEDNPGDAVIFREKLNASDLDYQLVHAKRLSEGLEQVSGDAFDILMVDLSLPDAQGMEAVDQLREAAPDSPLIVLTGLDDATAAAEAKQRGAVDYLVKWYVDSISLARYVRYAVEQYRVQRTEPSGADVAAAVGDAVVEVEGVVYETAGDTVDTPESTPTPIPARAPYRPAPSEPASTGSDLARQAAEAALAFVERSQRQSAWLADVLQMALALDRGVETKTELVDVLDLLNQVVRAQRSLAMAEGLPVRVSSQRKKVMAYTDRNIIDQALTRVVVDAIHDARHDGVQLSAEVEAEESTLVARWHSAGEDREAHAALGRRLIEDLIEQVGGTVQHATDATGGHTLTIRLPGQPEA